MIRSCVGNALLGLLAALCVVPAINGAEEDASIVVASTTSTQDSGLFSFLLPVFKERSGITVKVIAQGTGQALETARRGDADVVFVHDPEAEARFIEEGHGVARQLVMYNDFVIVGPKADPARIKGRELLKALQSIRRGKQVFVSRGDRSGTHQAELRLWKAAGVEVDPAADKWYRAVGQGMGPTLNIAAASNAYTLVDRASWISFRNKADLAVLIQGDKRLFNQYSLILVSSLKHPGVKSAQGQRFIDYLLSTEGQEKIASFRIDGQQLYFPNAMKE